LPIKKEKLGEKQKKKGGESSCGHPVRGVKFFLSKRFAGKEEDVLHQERGKKGEGTGRGLC